MASLSEKLRRERELRGISLKQISEDTKIGVRFLQALEEDKLELIPGEFYRRSYLRAYARYLGLDEDRAVNAYAFSNQEQRPDDASEEQRPHVSFPAWLPWVVVVAVLAVAAILLSRSHSSSMSRSSETAASTSLPARSTPTGDMDPAEPSDDGVGPETSVAAPSTSSVSIPSTSPPLASSMVPVLTPSRESAPMPEVPEGALRLVVAVAESCWLEIEADGTVVTTGLKEEGFRQEFTAVDEVRLWLGNAGGVSFWVNDRPLRSLGRAGQVRKDLSITRDNFMDYVTSEPGPS